VNPSILKINLKEKKMEGSPPSIEVWTEGKQTHLCRVILEKDEKSVPCWLLLPRILSMLDGEGISFDPGAVALKTEKGDFFNDINEIFPDMVVYLASTKDNHPLPSSPPSSSGIIYQGIFLEIPDNTNDKLLFACNAFGLLPYNYKIEEDKLVEIKRDVSTATVAYGGKLHTIYKTTSTICFYVTDVCNSVCKLLTLDPEKYVLLGGTSSIVESNITYTLTPRTGISLLLTYINITFGDSLVGVSTNGKRFLLTTDVLEYACSKFGLNMNDYRIDTDDMVILAGEHCKLIKK